MDITIIVLQIIPALYFQLKNLGLKIYTSLLRQAIMFDTRFD